jgi:hypothetical protein
MNKFLKGIIALTPIACSAPIFITTPSVSYTHSTNSSNAVIEELTVLVELAKNPYEYTISDINDTTTVLELKQSVIDEVKNNQAIDLKINELAIFYQLDHSRIIPLTNDVQTLAEYKVESQGKITVIINGEHGISDL